MQLAIVHYHLNRGGVSQVIANHLSALATLPADQQPELAAVLFSGARDGWPDDVWAGTPWEDSPPFEVQLLTVEALEYDTAVSCESEQLADAMHHALAEHGFDIHQTILHTHNHSLGKNASLPGALRKLAAQGYRLLLQVHDFAEDFRPANYRHLMRATGVGGPAELASLLYPTGAAVHYATLNGRDRALMADAGAERLHLLANPVEDFPELPNRDKVGPRVRERLNLNADAQLVVYPVRGIRRKNVGELLLHGALAGGEVCYAVTLAPENPAELVSFDRWQELADSLDLNCRLGIGQPGSGRRGVHFLDALSAADALVTTSVAEGFGMVFLEAWLAGKPLLGRNLPEITADFVHAGINLDGLQDQMMVPVEWFDLNAARQEVHELHRWACRDYGLTPPEEPPPEDWMTGDAGLDFASLPQRFQAEVIRRVASTPDACRAEIERLNPGYARQYGAESLAECQAIDANAKAVHQHFSPAAVGRRLGEVYASLMASEPCGKIGSLPRADSILHYFLRLDRLHPVRLES